MVESKTTKELWFLKEMLKEYGTDRKLLRLREIKRRKRRAWRILCPKCKHQSNTNEIFQENFVCESCRAS